MKKIIYGVLLLLVLALAACAGESTSNEDAKPEETKSTDSSKSAEKETEKPTEKSVIMKIGSTDKEHVAMGKAMYKFKEIVEAETNGSITVEVFPDSQLGGERDIIEGVQLGTIQGGPIGAAVMSNFSPRFNLWSLPFTFPTREDSHRILDGPLGQEVLADLDDIGMIGLNFWESGIRNLTNNDGEIKSPDDLANLKIRTLENQIQLDVWTELGAIPTPIAFPELFTSLQQGIVDGQENPFSVIAEANMYEVQKYVTETQHLIGVNPFIVNKKWFEDLTEDQQAAIRKATDEAQAFQREEKAIEDAKYKDLLIEKGMTITTLSPEERQVWADKIIPVYDKHKKEIGEDLVNRLLEEAKK
ncbi:TRAP transporter substrate-binding protein [Sporosarcina sp. FSL K6-2383]|uniref:TRAP transporter substrate-binding protein n=1 Tax=Sporosarcina sp. FSL K6-2383 TaxID=2921556 RepID=UPI00315A88E2